MCGAKRPEVLMPSTPAKTEPLDALLNVIRTWIETESGPHVKFSDPCLKLQVTIKGYKKIILERKFELEGK